MKKAFFKDINWEKVRNRDIDAKDVPYQPNENKYKYILNNAYPDISNIPTAEEQEESMCNSP